MQRILGHESPRTTELYARLATNRARDEYDAAMRAIAGAALGRVLAGL